LTFLFKVKRLKGFILNGISFASFIMKLISSVASATSKISSNLITSWGGFLSKKDS